MKQQEEPLVHDEWFLQCHFNPFGMNPEEEEKGVTKLGQQDNQDEVLMLTSDKILPDIHSFS